MQVMSLVLKEARELAQDHLDNKWHSCGSVVAAHGLNCPSTCGILVPRTWVPCIGSRILNHCTIGKSSEQHFLRGRFLELILIRMWQT